MKRLLHTVWRSRRDYVTKTLGGINQRGQPEILSQDNSNILSKKQEKVNLSP
jgi:hypothetical protein